ncbi:glycosyltransferase family 39 protein [Candidatus Woesearchaeota archaeon]|nr:glycosyltransferase family 39 protein [Candidatus Woesearchaeota archaeon]
MKIKKLKPKITKEYSLLALVIIAFLLIRIVLVTSSLKYVDSDELSIGIMAKNIIEKGEHPFFLYGQHYDGGAAIQGHFMAIIFLLFGVSSFSFNLSNLLIAMALVLLTYFSVKRLFDKKVALLTSLLLAVSPYPFTFLSQTKGHYMVSLFFNMLVIYIFCRTFFDGKNSNKYFALFGFVSAISWWVLEFVIPILIASFIFWYISDKRFFLKKKFFIFLGSFLIGFLPLIFYNLKHNFANIKQFLAGTALHKLVCKFHLIPSEVRFGDKVVSHCKIFGQTRTSISIGEFLTKSFPSLFGDGFSGWIYYVIFLAAVIFIVHKNGDMIKKFFIGLIPNQKFSKSIKEFSKEFYILICIALFSLSFFGAGFSGGYHLSPLFPLIAILLSIFIINVCKRGSMYRLVSISLVAILLLAALIGNIELMKAEPAEDIIDIINFMREEGIDKAYSTYFIKWALIFESNEEIIVSCENLCPCVPRYPLYEEIVRDSDKFGYVLHDKSTINLKFRSYLDENEIRYKHKLFDGKIVYYGISEIVRPGMAIESCTYAEGYSII